MNELRGEDYENWMRRTRFNQAGCNVHTFTECQGCGFVTWSNSTTGAEPVIRFIPMDKDFDCCPRCAAAQQRAPEVYAWVCGVADKLRADLEKTK